MPIRFQFRKEKIVTDATFYMFSEFVDLWNWDKSSKKKIANKMFYFIFLLCDLTETNPLKDTPAHKKEEEALHRVFKDRHYQFSDDERKVLEPAIYCYIQYNEMAEERILNIFDIKAEGLRYKLDNTKYETVENDDDGVISYATNSDIIKKGLIELDSVKKLRAIVVSSIKRDSTSNKIRGQQSLSPLSKGVIMLPDFADVFVDREEEE